MSIVGLDSVMEGVRRFPTSSDIVNQRCHCSKSGRNNVERCSTRCPRDVCEWGRALGGKGTKYNPLLQIYKAEKVEDSLEEFSAERGDWFSQLLHPMSCTAQFDGPLKSLFNCRLRF
jgi:hypothetical protein